jgi:hypothetical protein
MVATPTDPAITARFQFSMSSPDPDYFSWQAAEKLDLAPDFAWRSAGPQHARFWRDGVERFSAAVTALS